MPRTTKKINTPIRTICLGATHFYLCFHADDYSHREQTKTISSTGFGTPGTSSKKVSKVALTTKLTFKMRLAYRVTVKHMRTAVSLFNQKVNVNFGNQWLISTAWKNRNRRHYLSRLLIAARKPLQLNELILLHIRLDDSCTRVWFGITSQPAVDILLSTAFSNRFIHEIFLNWKKSRTLEFPASRNSSAQALEHGSHRDQLKHYENMPNKL